MTQLKGRKILTQEFPRQSKIQHGSVHRHCSHGEPGWIYINRTLTSEGCIHRHPNRGTEKRSPADGYIGVVIRKRHPANPVSTRSRDTIREMFALHDHQIRGEARPPMAKEEHTDNGGAPVATPGAKTEASSKEGANSGATAAQGRGSPGPSSQNGNANEATSPSSHRAAKHTPAPSRPESMSKTSTSNEK